MQRIERCVVGGSPAARSNRPIASPPSRKRILRPAKTVSEKTQYYCDSSGEKLGDSCAVHVTISCGYPSNRDGTEYHLHLGDQALDELMAFLRLRMLPRKIRHTGICYLGGQRVGSGPEDSMTKRKLRAAVQKQLG